MDLGSRCTAGTGAASPRPTCARAPAGSPCCSSTAGRRRSGSGGRSSSPWPRPASRSSSPTCAASATATSAPTASTTSRRTASTCTTCSPTGSATSGWCSAAATWAGRSSRTWRCGSRRSSSASSCSTPPCRSTRSGWPAWTPVRPARPPTTSSARALDADGLAADLATPEQRRRYIATFYTSRFWAHPGGFMGDATAVFGPFGGTPTVDFHTEPFADADKLRASFGGYESVFDPARRRSRPSWPGTRTCERCCSSGWRTTSSTPPSTRWPPPSSPTTTAPTGCRTAVTSCRGRRRTGSWGT